MTDRQTSTFDAAALDALLSEMAASEPAPLGGALRDDLVAAALAAQPVRSVPVARRGGWARVKILLRDLGGVPGLASLAAAGLVGLWIGLAPPSAAQVFLSPFLSSQTAEYDPFALFESRDLLSVITLDTEL